MRFQNALHHGKMPEWLMGVTRNHMASAAQVRILFLSFFFLVSHIFWLRLFIFGIGRKGPWQAELDVGEVTRKIRLCRGECVLGDCAGSYLLSYSVTNLASCIACLILEAVATHSYY